MKIILKRVDFRPESTISDVIINGATFCNVCEDTDRGLDSKMPLAQLEKMKVAGKTAIPYGIYEITISYSPRFKKMLPLLHNVPAYEGVRIHAGNTHKDTQGCLLPGKDTGAGWVSNSRYWFGRLMNLLQDTLKKERVFIEITK